MKKKMCPYCGKELSGEAVLCKYCHNLLIDEDGRMTETEDNALDDDRTKVFSKPEDDRTKRFVLPENGEEKGVIADAGADDVFSGSGFDDYDDYDDDDEAYDDYEENAARKRLFIITAVITVGILIVVIAAILMGMKLFGKKGQNDGANSTVAAKPAQTAPADTEESQPEVTDDQQQAAPVESTPEQSSIAPTEESSVSSADSESSSESGTDITDNGESSSSQADTDSSTANLADQNPTASDSSSSSQADDSSSQAEVDISDLENTVRSAVAGDINGDITGSQFRTEENGYAYYYFFTEDGAHGYSVAYNISTGAYVCEQNY